MVDVEIPNVGCFSALFLFIIYFVAPSYKLYINLYSDLCHGDSSFTFNI